MAAAGLVPAGMAAVAAAWNAAAAAAGGDAVRGPTGPPLAKR